MKRIVIYVHGKGGSAAEAEHYKALFPEAEVLGFDYRAQTPWEAKAEFPQFFEKQRKQCDRLTLAANSIGAFFSMSSLDETLIDRAYFISPVVDMKNLIENIMLWTGVSERELAEKQQELAEEIRRTVEELVDGVEYEDAFYRQLLDKMVIHDRNHVDVYLKFLPEKWSYAIAKASETAEAADCGIVETSVPISVSKPDTRG